MPPFRHGKTTSITDKGSPYLRRANQKHDARPDDSTEKNNDDPDSANGDYDETVNFQESEVPHRLNSDQQDHSQAQKSSSYGKGSGGYNALKSFNGQVYKGMAVGGSHTWNYDPGIWKETKTEPDLWHIDYETTKRRATNAPSGSGVPVGTEYHWLIVAHQYVKKVDANTYETHLVGSKYKLAHKGATSSSWSVSTVKAQRDRELELLEDAKRRVEGLPPVVAKEKVKVEKREKGQQKLDSLFTKGA